MTFQRGNEVLENCGRVLERHRLRAVIVFIDEVDCVITHLNHAVRACRAHAVITVGCSIGGTQVVSADLRTHAVFQRHHQLCGDFQITIALICHRRVMGKDGLCGVGIEITDEVDAVDGNPRNQAAVLSAVAEEGCTLTQTVGLLRGEQTDFSDLARIDELLGGVEPGVEARGLHGPEQSGGRLRRLADALQSGQGQRQRLVTVDVNAARECLTGHLLVIAEQTVYDQHIGGKCVDHGQIIGIFGRGQTELFEIFQHFGHGLARPGAAPAADLDLRQTGQGTGHRGSVTGVTGDTDTNHAWPSSLQQHFAPEKVV